MFVKGEFTGLSSLLEGFSLDLMQWIKGVLPLHVDLFLKEESANYHSLLHRFTWKSCAPITIQFFAWLFMENFSLLYLSVYKNVICVWDIDEHWDFLCVAATKES